MLTLEISKLSSFLDLPIQEANIVNKVNSFEGQFSLYRDLVTELKSFINELTNSVTQISRDHWTEKVIIFSDKKGNLYQIFFLYLLDIGKDTNRICYELSEIKNGEVIEFENFNPNLSLKENIQLLFEEPKINPISNNEEWEKFRKDNEFYWFFRVIPYGVYSTTRLGVEIHSFTTKLRATLPSEIAYRSEEEAKQAGILFLQNEAKKLS